MTYNFLPMAALLAVLMLSSTRAVVAEDAKAPEAKPANKMCPITDESIGDDAVTVKHRDGTVALCCKMCRAKWNKLSDKQKDAKLKKLGTARPTPAGKPAVVGDAYPLAVCPVSNKALGGMGAPAIKIYDGREVRFCCKGCIGRFEKAREKYFMKIDDLIVEGQEERYPLKTCVVSGGKLGSMGEPVDIVAGNRLVRLCCAGCNKKVAADPAAYIAKLDAAVVREQAAKYALKTCVVSGKKLGSMGKPAEIVFASRLVRFCCKGCVSSFRKSPARYVARLDAASAPASKAESKKAAGSGHSDSHKHDHD